MGAPEPVDRPDAQVSLLPDGDVMITTVAAACPCFLSDRNALLHVTLIELDDCHVRARVEEVLSVAPQLAFDVEEGAELDVPRQSESGCGQGLTLAAGDDALLVYAPAKRGDGALPAAALVATWASVHVFGEQAGAELSIPAGERDRLLDEPMCASWFREQLSSNPGAGLPGGSATCAAATKQ